MWVRNISHGAVPSHQQTKSQQTQILPKILMSSSTVQLPNTWNSTLAVSSPTVLCNRRMIWKQVTLWDSSIWPYSVLSILLRWPTLFKPQACCYCYYYYKSIIKFRSLTFETIQRTLNTDSCSPLQGGKGNIYYSWESPLNIWDFPVQNINLHSYYIRMSYLINIIAKNLWSSLRVIRSDKLHVSINIFIFVKLTETLKHLFWIERFQVIIECLCGSLALSHYSVKSYLVCNLNLIQLRNHQYWCNSFFVKGLRLLHVVFLALGLGALRLTTGIGLCDALFFVCIFF